MKNYSDIHIHFEINDGVKYVSGRHGDYQNNPLWGGKQGYIIGRIHRIFSGGTNINVEWKNGTYNTYAPKDLELYAGKYADHGHPLTTIFKD